MKDLVKSENLITLFDIYKNMLTKKQQEYFKYYYFDNYSLSEIAELFLVSKNSVFDLLTKLEKKLLKLEKENLFLKKKEMLISKIEELLKKYPEDLDLKKLKEEVLNG